MSKAIVVAILIGLIFLNAKAKRMEEEDHGSSFFVLITLLL